jgi:uncharacterized protein
MSLDLLLLYAGLAAAQHPQQASAPASAPAPPTVAQVRTTGTAVRSLPPDLAIATFELSSRGPSLNEAARAAASTGEAIRRAVVKAGVPGDSVLGRGSVSYVWDQATQMEVKPNSELKRYDTTFVFRDIVVVRIRDLKRVAAVLDGALAAGAQKLTSLQFSSSRIHQAGQEAITEASRQARQNAELMALAAGGKVGRPLELTTDRGPAGNAYYDLRGLNVSPSGSSPGQGLAVAPPNAELRVSVYARWELLPATDSLPAR